MTGRELEVNRTEQTHGVRSCLNAAIATYWKLQAKSHDMADTAALARLHGRLSGFSPGRRQLDSSSLFSVTSILNFTFQPNATHPAF
ncbi:uncharacterized [Tachysurus ichikawai]